MFANKGRLIVRAHPVAVRVVAAAATVVGSGRRCADRSRPHCRRTDTVAAIAVAPTADGDRTTPVSAHCDRTATVTASRSDGAAAMETSGTRAAAAAGESVVGSEGD